MSVKEILGQYFTPDHIVKEMLSLIENQGQILEPSCGDGAFLCHLPNAVGIEIDSNVAPNNALIMDFFDYNNKADTIIGNPPYVRYKDILETTKAKLSNKFNLRTNLYIFFIDRCIDLLNNNGELIFIVPRDFIKASSAALLNERLYKEGGFTYWKEYGDEKIFADASPNVVIFRWVKGGTHTIPVEYWDGYLCFNHSSSVKKTFLEDIFDIMVGGASGANGIFINEKEGNIDLVVSDTKKSGLTKKAVYVTEPTEYLSQYKSELINRKIKAFNEKNWWEWGRKIRHIKGEKIYVNNKTRDVAPFFTHESGWFDGSVIALVPKTNEYDIDYLIEKLNNNNWQEQGFTVGGRLVFGQRSLSKAYIEL